MSALAKAVHGCSKDQTPSLPDADPCYDRFRCGGRESNLAASLTQPRIRPSPFARTLRKWRTFRGLTLARAAAILGCTVPMLCKYEHGRNEPPVHRRAAIFAIIED